MTIEPPRQLSLERIAAAYGVSSATLREWKARGISKDDLLDPLTLAPKLRAKAQRNSPRLRLLENKTNALMIQFRLSI
jgi:hypothetical protein